MNSTLTTLTTNKTIIKLDDLSCQGCMIFFSFLYSDGILKIVLFTNVFDIDYEGI